ncbi:MAG: hypothetical protein N2111_02295 [Candidatus Sumerlaeaceae bacterium]|nr:hypothetical protein [Candidatus Sumerlaeaceae bacterium]
MFSSKSVKGGLLCFALAVAAESACAQNLIQANFTGVLVPQYMASNTNNRLPYAFRATISGLPALAPNTTYRYFTQAAINTDFGSTNSGAGNPLFFPDNGDPYTYSTGASLTSAGNYGTFTTDASGNYTGWFGFVHTGNTRFTAGNTIYPTVTIGDNTTGGLLYRRALDLGITVLQFNATSGPTNGTGIWGVSYTPARRFVALYDNVAGTGRPLALTPTQSFGVTIASSVPFYTTNVEGFAGRWGAIIPNVLASGVRRIERRGLDGSIEDAFAHVNTDADGVWPSGANTVNPAGGTTPIALTLTDAPLPVAVSGFGIE